jgi:UDP-N-acetylglucosamine--N-acetylmuramyl-(pentapeptide) pyrophosphoryl-undecaprenol N-acetylglucosamine transferase
MKTETKKVMITGGHVTPAIAVIDEIQSEKLPWSIEFVGRTTAFEGSGNFIQEQTIIQGKGIRFIPITTGRIQRTFTIHTLASLLKIPYGILQAFSIVRHENPDLILSFGGYIAFPVVIAAAINRIPIITHEQTRKPGLANRIIEHFAQKICVSFEDTAKYFPKQKTVYTGLPMRKEFFILQQKDMLPVPYKIYPIIYITGGSTGSASINTLMFPLVHRLIKKYTVIHQTGYMSRVQAEQLKHILPQKVKDRYIIRDYFDVETTAWILKKASLVVSRAGANTVMELAILQKKALLIPLPWAGAGEQKENARWLVDFGLATIIDQRTATSDSLYECIVQALQKQNKYSGILSLLPRDGAKQVVHQLL